MFRSILRTAALATALSAACAAHASDNDSSWRFSGFGTAGYAVTNSNDVLLANPGQFKGAQKGGSAASGAHESRCSTTVRNPPREGGIYVGFRCCADPTGKR